MRKNRILMGLVPALTLFSAQSMALPFTSIDPRSFAMGGTGVASGTSANAGFMNPALLAAANRDEDFALEAPILAGRFLDPENFLDTLDAYQASNVEDNFDLRMQQFKAAPTDPTAQSNLVTATNALVTQYEGFSDKPLQGEVLAGFVVGIPSKKLGMSLTSNVWFVSGGYIRDITADTEALEAIVAAIEGGSPPSDPNDPLYDPDGGTFSGTRTLQSKLAIKGALFAEVGLSIAREMSFGGGVAVGITPKYVSVTTFDAALSIDTADTSQFNTAEHQREYTNVNVDFGLAKDHHNGWKTAFVVKNLIPQEYETAPPVVGDPPGVIKVDPQPRIGVSHITEWTTVALDLDVVENEPAGYESKSQYLGLGAELDIFDTFQLRIGYKHNLSDSDTSVATAGIGFSPFGIHADLGVAANENEVGASIQLGFRF